MPLNRKYRGIVIVLMMLFVMSCNFLSSGGMQPLHTAVSEENLPAIIIDKLPAITQIPAQEEAIVFQTMDTLLAVNPNSGDVSRWQVHLVDETVVPLNGEQFQLHDFILWRDGSFYNLPAAHKAWQVHLSPDGQLVAYSTKTAPFLIHIGAVDGKNPQQWPHLGHNPLWSPDGQTLAFYGWDDVGETIHLYTANVDGGNLTSLIEINYPASDIVPPHLAWSPDSTKLAMLDNLTERFHNRLYILYADSREPTLLYEPSGGRLEDFRWSPDGSKLAFIAIASTGNDRHLIVLDAVNGETLASYKDVYAFSWSPDGTQLAMGVCVYGDDHCPLDVFLGLADGGQRSRLTELELALGDGIELPETDRFVWIGSLE